MTKNAEVKHFMTLNVGKPDRCSAVETMLQDWKGFPC